MSKKYISLPTTPTRLSLKQVFRSRIIILITCTIIAIYFYWMYLEYTSLDNTEKLVTNFIQRPEEKITEGFLYSKIERNNYKHPEEFQYLKFERNENELPEDFQDTKEEIKNNELVEDVQISKVEVFNNVLPENTKYSKVDLTKNELPEDDQYSKELNKNELPEDLEFLKVQSIENELPEDLQYLKNAQNKIEHMEDFETSKVKQNKNELTEEVQDIKVERDESKQLDDYQPFKNKNELTKEVHDSKTERDENERTNNVRPTKVEENKNELEEDLKYILLWTEYNIAPFYFFEEGQKSFIKNNCPEINCYVTANRTLFKGDITKFHAVAINGRNLAVKKLPERRSPHQKYIYFNMESSANFPVCDERFDGYFNWTATYKLDSDIPFPYIAVKNMEGDIVGPQTNMPWPQEFPEMDDDLSAKLANKTKAAAWFVSHCNSKSGRDKLVKNLQKALEIYGLTVDVYGRCGPFDCPRNQTKTCNSYLEKDYFFYMSLENSFAEDYITEKLLTALQHDTVPIVYGGADYSKFLSPGSYIDSTEYDVEMLAATIAHFMKTPDLYSRFFRWKSMYTYTDPSRKENVCTVCAAMHNKEKFETKTVYKHFRKWWNPNYDEENGACKT